jgi:hypothetical protein
MSYDTLKYVLWVLLSLPVLAIGILCLSKLGGDIFRINSFTRSARASARSKKRSQEERVNSEIMRRRQFEEDYRKRRGGF